MFYPSGALLCLIYRSRNARPCRASKFIHFVHLFYQASTRNDERENCLITTGSARDDTTWRIDSTQTEDDISNMPSTQVLRESNSMFIDYVVMPNSSGNGRGGPENNCQTNH